MNTTVKDNWGTMVGILSVAIVPLAFLDRVNRFTLLPQLMVAYLGILVGYAGLLRYGSRRRWAPIISVAACFLGVELVSVASAHTPALSLVPIMTDFAYVSLLALIVVGLTRLDIDRTLSATALVSGVVSLIGLLQYLDIGRHWIPTSGLPSATLGHRNIAAAYAVGTLPYILWKLRDAERRLDCLLWSACAALCVAFLIATRSRGAWLSIGVACAITAALWIKTRGVPGSKKSRAFQKGGGPSPPSPVSRFRILALMGGGVCVVLFSLVPARIEKNEGEAMWHEKASVSQAILSISARGGDKGRLILWDTTLKMIRNQPMIGVGPGNWRIQYPVHAEGRMIDAQVAPHRPHNDLLALWAESGIGALILFLMLLFYSFRSAWRSVSGPDRTLVLASVASIVGCVANSLFSFPKEFAAASMPLWLGMGLLAVLDNNRVARSNSPGKWVPALGVCLAVAGLAAGSLLIRFDGDLVSARLAAVRLDWQSVLDATDRVNSFAGVDEQAHLLRARAYEGTDRHDKAIEAYRKGLSIHPHATSLWLGLGVAQRMAGQLDSAQESFERALLYDPQDGRVLNNLGTLIASQGDLERATAYLERALTAESTPVDVYGNLSTVFRRAGALDKAIESARRGLEIESSGDLANALGNALAARGDHQEAVRVYLEGFVTAPDHVQLLFNLARSYESLNRAGEAIRTYHKVLARVGESFPERRKFVEKRLALLEKGTGSQQ